MKADSFDYLAVHMEGKELANLLGQSFGMSRV